MIIFGAFPLVANTPNRDTVSSLPTISSNRCGRYFSILINVFTLIKRFEKREQENVFYHGRFCFLSETLLVDCGDRPLGPAPISIGVLTSTIFTFEITKKIMTK